MAITEQSTDGDIGQAFADAVGVEKDTLPVPEAAQSFFDDVRAAGIGEQVATPAVPSATPHVHEPTGKQFETEIDLLKYDSGYNNQKFGQANAELREQLANVKGQLEAGAPNNTAPTAESLKQQLWPTKSAEALADPAADFVLEGMNSMAAMMQAQFKAQIDAVQAENAGLKETLARTDARNQHGVKRDVESKILQEHPSLAQLPPNEAMAVIRALADKQGGDANPSSLAAKLTANAAEHVEGTGLSNPISSEDAVDAAFAKAKTPQDELAILSALVQRDQKFGSIGLD